jgi:hypothetical protein
MSDRPYAAYWYDELLPHKIHLARCDGCLLVTLASSGGQKGETRGPGRDLAFERLLRRLSDAFPSGCARAYRTGSQQGQRAVRVNGLLAQKHATLLAAKTSGGDYRFDLWVEGVPDVETEIVASTIGLVKHRDQHSQPRTLPPLAELLPPPETRAIPLPKPFILLAGLSGTGKTSFVRAQARRVRGDEGNFALIPVRPDWHEPSELFGHLSRIHGERFLATPFLKFVAHAWREAVASADADHLRLRPLDDIPTFWADLDDRY